MGKINNNFVKLLPFADGHSVHRDAGRKKDKLKEITFSVDVNNGGSAPEHRGRSGHGVHVDSCPPVPSRKQH